MIKRYFVNALILHSATLFHNGWFYSMRMGKIHITTPFSEFTRLSVLKIEMTMSK